MTIVLLTVCVIAVIFIVGIFIEDWMYRRHQRYLEDHRPREEEMDRAAGRTLDADRPTHPRH